MYILISKRKNLVILQDKTFRLMSLFTHFPCAQVVNNFLLLSAESCYTERVLKLEKGVGCIFHNYVFTGLIDLLSSYRRY
jgi:hypothetical protein